MKIHLALLAAAWLIVGTMEHPGVLAQTVSNDDQGNVDLYPAAYFAEFSPVTAVDMLDRIPGISFILQGGGGGNRGFGSNSDRILIDGRRVSGKTTNGRVVLARIAATQVKRIEILRAGSTDAENRTLDTQVNIVLNATANEGDGTWSASVRRYRGDTWRPGGKVTYAGKIANVDYSLGFEAGSRSPRLDSVANKFDSNLTLTGQTIERETERGAEYSGSGDISIEWNRGDAFRLNGIYAMGRASVDRAETVFLTQGSALIFDRIEFEAGNFPSSNWEVGGDYVRPLGNRFEFKLLGLHNVGTNEFRQRTGTTFPSGPVVNEISNSERRRTESVLRLGLAWDIAQRHNLEFGVEGVQNTLDAQLEIFELTNGQFVPLDIELSDSRVRENRAEVFIVHNWQPGSKWKVQSGLFAEFSTISQIGSGINASRSFSFFKPALELRYDVNEKDKIEISFERQINQLRFGAFVASLNDEFNMVDEGNPDIVQQKNWSIEAIWDRRLRDDGSSVRMHGFYTFVEDVINQVAIPGTDVGTIGNIGNGRNSGIILELSLKLDWLKMPRAILEGRYEYNWSRVTDPFTGMKRRLNFQPPYSYSIEVRQDVPKFNLFYGLAFSNRARRRSFRIDEIRQFSNEGFFSTFVEYRFRNGWALRLDAGNLLNSKATRVRDIFVGRISSGVLDQIERQETVEGRELEFSLRGTF